MVVGLVVVVVVLVLVLGGFCYKKPTIYLYAKNSAARFITILAPSARFIIILALKALFFSQFWRLSALFKEPKALFIWRRRRFVLSKALCKHLL